MAFEINHYVTTIMDPPILRSDRPTIRRPTADDRHVYIQISGDTIIL